MAIEARIRELGSRHNALERAIQEEVRRPAADATRLGAMKRQKLRLKEEMANLQSKPH